MIQRCDKQFVQQEVYLPARLSWNVYNNISSAPNDYCVTAEGGSSLENIHTLRFSLKPLKGIVCFEPNAGEVFHYAGTSSQNTGMVITAWYRASGAPAEWRWRGTADVRTLHIRGNYMEASLTHRRGSKSFVDRGEYYFTVGGFF